MRSFYADVVKRSFDVIAAGAGLAVLAPVLGAVAVAVRIKHGAPVLFEQERIGRDDIPFRIRKFRTMTNERDARGELLPDHQRMTKLGAFLRETSLDELPELLNVLRGEMSLIGPRPLLPEYLPLYSSEQRRRHAVRPGLTGLAAVNGRNQTSWQQRLRLDVEYVDNMGPKLDLEILLRTVRLVVSREGVNESSDTTMPRFRGNDGDQT